MTTGFRFFWVLGSILIFKSPRFIILHMYCERSLYSPIIRHFEFAYEIHEEIHPFPENKSYSKSIDLVMQHKGNECLVAIEVKLSDWRKALQQALLNTPYCDFCYVAFPHSLAVTLDKGLFFERGIGLLGVKKRGVEEIVKAKSLSPIRRLSLCNYSYATTHRKASRQRKH